MHIHWLQGYYRNITNATFEAIEYRVQYNNGDTSHLVQFDFYDGDEDHKYIYGLLCSLDGKRMKIYDCTNDGRDYKAEVALDHLTFEEKVAAVGRACGL
jgi:hypothetical protein